ncbi:MAG: hypothetical protein ACREMO_08420 [Gemmatimonadales bacterium]
MAPGATAQVQATGCDAHLATVIADGQTWGDLYSAHRHDPCDDGVVARAISRVVVRSLARRWQDLPQLQQLVAADSTFMTLVLRHIDGASDPDELKAIGRNAQRRCPKKHEPLCARIAEAAEAASGQPHQATAPN